MHDGHRIVQLISLFKRHFELLEAGHHWHQQHQRNQANLQWLRGKPTEPPCEGTHFDLAGLFQGQFLGGQDKHEGGQGRDAQQVDEEQADGDDGAKDLQEGQGGEAEGKEPDDVGGDGDHQRNRGEDGPLPDRPLPRGLVEVA